MWAVIMWFMRNVHESWITVCLNKSIGIDTTKISKNNFPTSESWICFSDSRFSDFVKWDIWEMKKLHYHHLIPVLWWSNLDCNLLLSSPFPSFGWRSAVVVWWRRRAPLNLLSSQQWFTNNISPTRSHTQHDNTKLFSNELNEKLKQCEEMFNEKLPHILSFSFSFCLLLVLNLIIRSILSVRMERRCRWQWKHNGLVSCEFLRQELFLLSLTRCDSHIVQGSQLSRVCEKKLFRALLRLLRLLCGIFFGISSACFGENFVLAENTIWYKNVNEKNSPKAVENLNS